MNNKLFVFSVGGSLVNPDELDSVFLKRFKGFITRQVKRGYKFVLIVGGGKNCRRYQQALRKASKTSAQELDWIGIHVTRLNAQLVRLMFGRLAQTEIIIDPSKKVAMKSKILVAAGWKPGWSTDYDAVLLAKNFNASLVVNLSNIDFVYTKDPRKHKDAKPIRQMSWGQLRNMTGSTWDPGLNMPFDPIASKLAEKLGLRVIIANGKNLQNLERILSKKSFVGTEIK